MTITIYMHYFIIFSMLLPIPFPLISMAIFLLYSAFKQQLHPLLWGKQHPLIHLFFSLSLLSSFIYNNVIGIFISIALYLLFWYFMLLKSQITHELFHNSLKVFVYGSWLHALYAFLQYKKILFGPDYHAFHPAMISWRDGRADSVFLNPNYYAMMCLFFTLIALYLFYIKKIKWEIIPSLLLNFAGIYFTQSRTPLLALIVSIATFFIVVYPKQKRKLLIIGIGTLICLTPFIQLLPRFDFNTIITHLIDIRFQIWQTSLNHIQKTAITGSGPFTYLSIYAQYNSYATQHAHNLYIDSLLNYGITGFVLLSVIGYKHIKKLLTIKNHPLQALSLGCLSIILVHGLLDVSILWVHCLFIFGFINTFCLQQNKIVDYS